MPSRAWFLEMTRTMLLTERGDELWLAPFVTTHWMKDGMQVSVSQAPTRFGTVSYTLRSQVAAGQIEALIQTPVATADIAEHTDRSPLARIVLRVRHPEGKPMRSVTVNGRQHTDFDSVAQLIRLAPAAEPISVRIDY